ncbi:oligopeptide/dipeptide ABC transporter ATP-binding protein [Alicyclobacillus macrosporangiidus]|uniref:oligopeptide/dipeptide ABC transporter ATP-binding protein n=1 Tax=Alicyclobacillus macrosporangiidus TaxID=392015 RepID=UPI000AED495B|nr:ABC transporter ATP-binding protein [Alicyclobacillus macrosporangiidus]
MLKSPAMVELKDVRVEFVSKGRGMGRRQRVVALDGVSLSIQPGETLGIAGESGSGKTTLARVLTGLQKPTAGDVRLFGGPLPARDWPKSLRRRIQMVFQDASGFLDPRQPVVQSVMEVLSGLTDVPAAKRRSVADELLRRVGLDKDAGTRFPHELSGGQRQRVAIARALASSPDFFILDEPTSALDVSVQAQILNLFVDLRRERGIGYLLISHDLNVIAHLCDRVAVMYRGRIVEEGPVDELFQNPRHPYTRALLSAVPDPDPRVPWEPVVLRHPVSGEDAAGRGCRFHPRCPLAGDVCRMEEPPWVQFGAQRVACHFPLDREGMAAVPEPAAERERRYPTCD